VTNQDDGTVEVTAEGDAEALERFERKLRQGPSRSRVENVMIDDIAPTSLSGGFIIK
jgi:acylphosphatase